MSQNTNPEPPRLRFLEAAIEACEEDKLDTRGLARRVAELQEYMLREWERGVTELELPPIAAKRRALRLLLSKSRGKHPAAPADVGLLFSRRCRNISWFAAIMVLIGIAAKLTPGVWKSAVPIVIISVASVIIGPYIGFRHAGSTQTIAQAGRIVPPDSASSTTSSITGPKLNSEFAQQESGGAMPVSSKPGGAIADTTTMDGLLGSWLESPIRHANEEPLSYLDLGAMRGGAGIEPAPSEIASGNKVGSSTLPSNGGATIPATERKMNEVATGVASLAKKESKIAGGNADSPYSAGLVVPNLQPAVHRADQVPPQPPVLRVVAIGP